MKKNLFMLAFWGAICGFAQELPLKDSINSVDLEEVSLIDKLPVTSQKIGKNALNLKNLGQDVPTLLSTAVSVVNTSDAGAGIGYSSVRIRGISQQQINVTLNGVPVNDAESQGVFWVNMPDLASSTSSIVIQRGVGTSSNGVAAFGASINIETNAPEKEAYFTTTNSWGSFGTQKYTIQTGTGAILNNHLRMDLRASYLNSDGYIDRAFSKFGSYNFTAQYTLNDKTSFRFQNMYGREKTYQAWGGIDQNTLDHDRRFNPMGAIYNADYSQIVGYYNNQTDNYQQNHYYLSWDQEYGNNWKSTVTLHYTKGKGYYEEYKQDAALYKYKIDDLPFESIDLVRRQWLDNDFYGVVFGVENQNLGDFKLFLGGSANRYDGDHFGKIIWMKNYDWTNKDYKYYNNNAVKDQVSTYAKLLYTIGKIDLFADLQYRYVSYKTKYLPNGENDDDDFRPYNDQFNFVNPKAGINYNLNGKNTIYAAYGLSHREPTRADYEGQAQLPKNEDLHDFELGYKKNGTFSLNLNGFYMYYLNQLVPTGRTNDVGTPIRVNSGKSYRTGVELEAKYELITNKIFLFGNMAYSLNKNKNFTEEAYDSNGNLELISYGKTSIAFSPEWVGAFGAEYHPIKNLLLNVSNKYVGEQYLSNTEPKDGKLKDYLTTDVLLKYGVHFKGLKKLEFSFLINNIFDVEYENNGYYYEGPYYFPQAGINFLGGISLSL